MNHYVSYLIYYVRIAITNLSAIGLRDLNSIARQQGEVAYVVGNFLFQVIFVCFFSSLLIHVNEAETKKNINREKILTETQLYMGKLASWEQSLLYLCLEGEVAQ